MKILVAKANFFLKRKIVQRAPQAGNALDPRGVETEGKEAETDHSLPSPRNPLATKVSRSAEFAEKLELFRVLSTPARFAPFLAREIRSLSSSRPNFPSVRSLGLTLRVPSLPILSPATQPILLRLSHYPRKTLLRTVSATRRKTQLSLAKPLSRPYFIGLSRPLRLLFPSEG